MKQRPIRKQPLRKDEIIASDNKIRRQKPFIEFISLYDSTLTDKNTGKKTNGYFVNTSFGNPNVGFFVDINGNPVAVKNSITGKTVFYNSPGFNPTKTQLKLAKEKAIAKATGIGASGALTFNM